MRKLSIIIVTIAIAAFTAGAALADGEKGHVCFKAVDTDQNGVVTLEEFEKYFGEDPGRFETADTDKSGTLSHDEYHHLLGGGAS